MDDSSRRTPSAGALDARLAAASLVAEVLVPDRSKARHPIASQIRAARALLDWSQAETAKAVGITTAALDKIERGITPPAKKTMVAFQEAFSAAGAILIPSGETVGEGLGVRLRKAEP